MPSPNICHVNTEINELFVHLVYLLIGWQRGLEEQIFQYVTKNPDRGYTCALCGKVSRDLYNAKRHLMKCFKS